MILFIISFVLLGAYYFLIHYYHKGWKQVPCFDSDAINDLVAAEKISVIVPARNEEAVIEQCILSLLQQSYPKALLEIIIADDHSTDGTAAIVQRYRNQGIQLLSLQEKNTPGKPVTAFKKKAIETAIQAATGTLIVTTDADCTFHKNWISTIAAFHRHSKAVFIVSPVKIKPGHAPLSVFQSIDFAILQGITAASVHKKFHSMCNGANLAYEKAAFNEVNGFENIDHVASGDDMLLMQKINSRHPGRIAYLNAPEAIVETLPAPNWRAFITQRIRWASKTGQYKDKRIVFVLALVYILNLCLFVLLAGSIAFPGWLLFFGVAVFYKTLIEWHFVKDVLTCFNLGQFMRWFPLFQPLHIAYTVIAGFLGSFGSYEWKGRKVK
ncbi:glycosyltransferase [Agriterribacter sp.]|uniref:glycosyltransferase n=1 Tax=Agriterribacter sp. TaxID=2821509 RepID=UPI002B8A86AE|nr:glycosyltransferase [Agriterribacter sp.]HRO45316.1 glycosyltransferase [Agriterribacter sp.]HRQ17123.1 glycosyltransferase [Agriterribacter sp.]